MSHAIDELYAVYNEEARAARKAHRCVACRETIAAGHRYTTIAIVEDGRGRTIKRCARCQAIHEHLRDLGRHSDMWPDERLDCGEEYSEHWGKAPPEHIAALAFWRPGDAMPEGTR